MFSAIFAAAKGNPAIIEAASASLKAVLDDASERDDFNEVGFLLTDYCTDLYDGKQAHPTYTHHELFTTAPKPINLTTNPEHHS